MVLSESGIGCFGALIIHNFLCVERMDHYLFGWLIGVRLRSADGLRCAWVERCGCFYCLWAIRFSIARHRDFMLGKQGHERLFVLGKADFFGFKADSLDLKGHETRWFLLGSEPQEAFHILADVFAVYNFALDINFHD